MLGVSSRGNTRTSSKQSLLLAGPSLLAVGSCSLLCPSILPRYCSTPVCKAGPSGLWMETAYSPLGKARTFGLIRSPARPSITLSLFPQQFYREIFCLQSKGLAYSRSAPASFSSCLPYPCLPLARRAAKLARAAAHPPGGKLCTFPRASSSFPWCCPENSRRKHGRCKTCLLCRNIRRPTEPNSRATRGVQKHSSCWGRPPRADQLLLCSEQGRGRSVPLSGNKGLRQSGVSVSDSLCSWQSPQPRCTQTTGLEARKTVFLAVGQLSHQC